jgi:signal transduction histidine kinase
MVSSENMNLLKATIESIGDGIYVSGTTDEHLISNTRFSEMFRIPKIFLKSNNFQDALEKIADQVEDPISFLSWTNSLKGQITAELYTIKLQDGRTLECYSAPLYKDEKEHGRVWTFEDITRLKKTEETAMLYLDLMSHDIRNRLQGIVMSVEILNLLVDDPESTTTIVDIEENVRRCTTLISKIKAAEGINKAPMFPRSLTEAIRNSIKIINERFSEIVIQCEFEENQIFMYADSYLETLFVNILENAIQHNPKKTKQIWVKLRKLNNGIEISISDNGIGIDNQRKLDIFDKNRRYGGVGLHVASTIVGKYGGNIKILDRVFGDSSQGVDFIVSIPAPIVKLS